MEKMRETYNAAIIELYSNETLNNYDQRQKIGSYLGVITSAKTTTSDLKKKANQKYE